MWSKSIGMAGLVLALGALVATQGMCAKPGKTGKGPHLAQADTQKAKGGSEVVVHATPEEIQATADGNNRFAFRLLPQLRTAGQNLFFSPFSIRTALAMMASGAAGDTLETMHTSLEMGQDGDANQRAMGALLAKLRSTPESGYTLSVANSLWGQNDYGFFDAFINTVRQVYFGDVKAVDFKVQFESVRKEINAWVEERTNGIIQDLIPGGGVTTDTRMVLVNAVYFKGLWQSAFEKGDTQDLPFHPAVGGDANVPMMRRMDASELVAVGKGVKMLRLAYKGSAVAMDIILPDAADGLEGLVQDLGAERLGELTGRLRTRDVNIVLPRFKLRWGTNEISKALAELGLADVLGKEADFSKVARLGAAITGVFHQAFVDVNEEGTEAAAATAIVAEAGCAAPEPPLEFRADHPFLFLIRDLQTGAILFLGVVENPSA